ncbi:Photosystem I subunit O [Cardamine amara subsp. amara]|uniref:Photosystem I subunit O n=1 Tax=Cardamine amara subsp. amara TaxID=228776 RepID=A0ABD1AD32_CARAN
MAATFATPSTVIGLGGSSIKAKPFSSSFLKPTSSAKNPLRLAGASGGRVTCFERNWLRRDLNVVGFGLIGWLAPSSIPAINAIASQFWLWLVTWHLGLFLCLTFGQIGFKGRTEGYFEK